MNEQGVALQKQEVESTTGVERMRPQRLFVPRVDIHESGEEVVLLVDMPGVDETSVDITLERNLLTIRGRVDSPEPEGYRPVYEEYQAGDFERSFALSDQVDQEGIQAAVKNGVLRLTLPKSKRAKVRRISVRSEV